MTYSRLGLGVSIAVSLSLVSVPSATALDAQLDTRNGKEICVVSLDSAEKEISKKYFAAKLEEQTKLQNRMRQDFPQYADSFARLDSAPQTHNMLSFWSISRFALPTEAELVAQGYDRLDASYLLFTNSDTEAEYKEWAANGYPFNWEVARNWTPSELAEYPYGDLPVVNSQNGEVEDSAMDLRAQVPSYSAGLHAGFPTTSQKLTNLMKPGELRLQPLEDEFEAVAGLEVMGFTLPFSSTVTLAGACENAYLAKEQSEAEASTTPPTSEPVPSTSTTTAPTTSVVPPSSTKPTTTRPAKTTPAATPTAPAKPTTAKPTTTKPKPTTTTPAPKPNKTNDSGSSTGGIIAIVLAILAAAGIGVVAFLPQLGFKLPF
ncbi:hypothetical protein AWU68_1586 [Corynebacterium simulans]|uniref:Uncharacterized protein n=1 Tax=Corynebacterium accolens TaxID=38284 RepID=A0A2A4AMU1_9CORY|nr:hypothetical protein [Corynebacterium simulans]AMO91860.1 hypothetical protein AWU68_1586 [Corynebacterium simulans]PCC83600.1 hypothetical protein COM45_02280 [Corynebacterium accolens]